MIDSETGAVIHRADFGTDEEAQAYAAYLAWRIDLDGMGVPL